MVELGYVVYPQALDGVMQKRIRAGRLTIAFLVQPRAIDSPAVVVHLCSQTMVDRTCHVPTPGPIISSRDRNFFCDDYTILPQRPRPRFSLCSKVVHAFGDASKPWTSRPTNLPPVSAALNEPAPVGRASYRLLSTSHVAPLPSRKTPGAIRSR